MSQRELLPREGIQVFIPPARQGRPVTKPVDMKVLIAEDDRDVRTLLGLILRLDGHQVTEASTPLEAVACAVDIRPDLIVLDRTFSGTDGLTALRKLREEDQTKEIPLILISGKSEALDQISGLEEGADVYLVKPFDPFLFLETVWEITSLSPDQRVAARVKELARLRMLVPPAR